MGKNGRGWRRFLLFAELTKGRKGAEYVALFAYFSFEGKYQEAAQIHSTNGVQLGYALFSQRAHVKS